MSLVPISCLLSHNFCLLSHIYCLMSPTSRVLSTVLRFLSQVYGLAHLSCQSHVIYTGIDLAELAVL